MYSDFDYLIVVDTDLKGGWSYEGISHTFGCDDWDFVGSNGVLKQCRTRPNRRELVQFDSWAFRAAEEAGPSQIDSVRNVVFVRGGPLLPVRSCFGGLGVYRLECVEHARYGGTDCEHVVLHEAMRKLGFDRLFLNPSQLIVY
jgi:hypothetical protein